MWKRVFSPEVLFLIGASQALFPYLIWSFAGSNPLYIYPITYTPLLIWIIGYCSFFCGCFFCGSGLRKSRQPDFNSDTFIKINFKTLKKSLIVLSIFILTQIFFISLSYGYFPLQEIISGGSSKNIQDINIANEDSALGQFALFINSLFLFNGLLLTLIIKSVEEKRKLGLSAIFCILIAIIGTLSTGKRQGLFMMIFFVIAGLSIRFDNPIQSIFRAFDIYLTRKRTSIIFLLTAILMINFLGFFASARVGSGYQISALDEVSSYLQLPLINFEAQCEQAGFGPSTFNPMYTFSLLLPTKIYRDLGYFNLLSIPIYPEVTSPAGFYQLIHWGLGTGGIVACSFVIGLISKYFYNNSLNSLLHLLIYSQITWALFSAYAYNHFLFLPFLPLPCILFGVFHWMLCLISSGENSSNI